mmetsp:Transcript_43113/g.91893  ORF Transcript_43113/g.91893 Transcript_43113/m.91893 type:complete len:264 (-) Transcript_43113:565-1356(-)
MQQLPLQARVAVTRQLPAATRQLQATPLAQQGASWCPGLRLAGGHKSPPKKRPVERPLHRCHLAPAVPVLDWGIRFPGAALRQAQERRPRGERPSVSRLAGQRQAGDPQAWAPGHAAARGSPASLSEPQMRLPSFSAAAVVLRPPSRRPLGPPRRKQSGARPEVARLQRRPRSAHGWCGGHRGRSSASRAWRAALPPGSGLLAPAPRWPRSRATSCGGASRPSRSRGQWGRSWRVLSPQDPPMRSPRVLVWPPPLTPLMSMQP